METRVTPQQDQNKKDPKQPSKWLKPASKKNSTLLIHNGLYNNFGIVVWRSNESVTETSVADDNGFTFNNRRLSIGNINQLNNPAIRYSVKCTDDLLTKLQNYSASSMLSRQEKLNSESFVYSADPNHLRLDDGVFKPFIITDPDTTEEHGLFLMPWLSDKY